MASLVRGEKERKGSVMSLVCWVGMGWDGLAGKGGKEHVFFFRRLEKDGRGDA